MPAAQLAGGTVNQSVRALEKIAPFPKLGVGSQQTLAMPKPCLPTPLIVFLCLLTAACSSPDFDLIVAGGMVYDGTGQAPFKADIGVKDGKIMAVGDLAENSAAKKLDAGGLAVSPGFINVLSWAAMPLVQDGRSMSDIKQGVTLEIFGEGSSPGPISRRSKESRLNTKWTTLGGYLDYVTQKGVSCNVASFVGASTVRINVLGYDDVQPDSAQLEEMCGMVREAMREGALGVGSSLIYPPAFFASTAELTALSKAAGEYGGMYISHLRSEGNALIQAVDELMAIAHGAGVPAEIYHLKAAGKDNWHKIDQVLQKIDSAQKAGLQITANMYNYEAASTGLGACFPPWSQEGGDSAWIARLSDPAIRQQIKNDILTPSDDWENFYLAAGKPENILVVGADDSLQHYNGKTLADAAGMMGLDPLETLCELIVRNGGRVQAVYFLMSEDNIRKQMKLPYMSFGSDARSIAAEGKTLESSTHPRTYGNFARLLGRYVREEKVIPLEEAIHKLTLLPAKKLKIKERGCLAPGFYADIVLFDPATVADKATYQEPHQYAVGVAHVFVNGVQVLKNGEHTGAMPGMAVRGPGYQGPVTQ